MSWKPDIRERVALVAAYRAHLRALNAARQDAERRRGMRGRDPEERRAAEDAFQTEWARLADEHQAWLRAHGFAVAPLAE